MTAVAVATRLKRVASLTWVRERGMGATILVAATSTTFGVVLLNATAYLAAVVSAGPYGGADAVAIVIGILSTLLVGVAVYVAAIVTANTFGAIVAGRTRLIALYRLIGASARAQRREVARQGLTVGILGAAVGLLLGVVISFGGIALVETRIAVPSVEYAVVQPTLLAPALIVSLTTWAAAWAGSRRVLAVTPLQALGGSVEASHDVVARRIGRNVVSLVLCVLGASLLAVGVIAGLSHPIGVAISFAGGILSFTALILGSARFMPPLLRAVGRMFGRSATARLAAENALRYPERSSRMAIGIVMGVTLVTMFAVALESAKRVMAASAGGEVDLALAATTDTFSAVMMGLVAVSAVIAAVGIVNLLSIGVVQRRRELGLLRALGLSARQIRRMVLFEAAHITITAVAFGLILGIVYGWAGAQSLFGSVPLPPAWTVPTLVWPAVPLVPVLVIVAATAVLTLVATVVPTRLATRVAPVEALVD